MKRDPETILDELLLLRWQSGDQRAFERLFARHHPRIMRLAMLRVGHGEAAADIVQEVWAAAVRTVRKVRDPAKFQSWLDQIVRNKSIDWIRKSQRRRALIRQVSDNGMARDIAVSPVTAESEARKDSLNRLRLALGRLSEEQREILSKLYLHGRSVEQIAAELGIPKGTVKSRLFHARDALRRAYERDES